MWFCYIAKFYLWSTSLLAQSLPTLSIYFLHNFTTETWFQIKKRAIYWSSEVKSALRTSFWLNLNKFDNFCNPFKIDLEHVIPSGSIHSNWNHFQTRIFNLLKYLYSTILSSFDALVFNKPTIVFVSGFITQ